MTERNSQKQPETTDRIDDLDVQEEEATDIGGGDAKATSPKQSIDAGFIRRIEGP